jgi:hypothetical protein
VSIFESIRAHLIASVDVNPIVGARIYNTVLPENEVHNPDQFPALTMQQITRVPHHSQEGFSGYTDYRFQFNGWAKTEAEIDALATALFAALDSFRGLMPVLGSDQIQVDSCFMDSEDRGKDDPGDGREMWLLRQDYTFAVIG